MLRPGTGGWVRYDDPEQPGPLYVRFKREDDGRWQTTEVYLDGRGATVTGAILRELPVPAIEAFVNSDEEFSDALADQAGLACVLLSEAASYFSGMTITPKTKRTWLVDMLLSQFPNNDVPKVRRRPDPIADELHAEVPPLRAPEDGLTDDFLRHVAAAYAALVLKRDRKPAETLAKQVGPDTKVRTVHDWIYMARKRGFMAPGRRGKVG